MITKLSDDDVFTSLQIEQPNGVEAHSVINKDDSFVNSNTNITNEEPADLNSISKCQYASKESSDTEFVVQNLLFDLKHNEFSLANSEDKTCIQSSNKESSLSDCNLKFYNNEDNDKSLIYFPTSISTFNTSNETQILSNRDETNYSAVNNTYTVGKKRGFSIEEISKDETSQNSQNMTTYSNDYTCFLSEQTDAVSNLTPFRRNNSYYFDSPVKKLCTSKPSSEEKSNELLNSSLYTNENDTYTGFTSIQNDLKVDCIQDRYDGSDSGFGSELAEDKTGTNLDVVVSNISYKNDFTQDQKSSFEDLQRTSNEFLSAMEVLKPKFADSVQEACPLEISNNYGVVKGILKRKSVNYGVPMSNEGTSVKKRKNINFANVTVFYFPRVQGFTCVPSQVNILISNKLIIVLMFGDLLF